MILKDLVDANRVSFHKSFENWEDAIWAAAGPLLNEGAIEDAYVNAMINSVKEHGPYIVFAPNIAMPHCQQGAEGVHKTAISFMKVEEPVCFEEGNPEKDARLFFVLASQNNDQHMANMEKLAVAIMAENFTEKMLEVKSIEDMLALDAALSV